VLEASLELAPDIAGVGVARRFVDRVVTDWGLDHVRDDALIITSELAANAIVHARTDFHVRLQSDGAGYLCIEVRDNSDRMPSPGRLGQVSAGGRGLAIVAALATFWEVRVDGAGKVVRAEILLRHRPGASDGLHPSGSGS
jgi:anti-sigma regulatory factor (Ser/Thr protein kinase)